MASSSSWPQLGSSAFAGRPDSAERKDTMTLEIDLAPEFVCLSFIVWGARGAQRNKAAAHLARQDNQ
jgi:hypothetical protein